MRVVAWRHRLMPVPFVRHLHVCVSYTGATFYNVCGIDQSFLVFAELEDCIEADLVYPVVPGSCITATSVRASLFLLRS